MSPTPPLPPDVQQALQNGQMVEAFRLLRQHQRPPTAPGSRPPPRTGKTRLPSRRRPTAALTGHVDGLPRRRPGLAPGEVPPSRDGLVLGLIAAALLVWLVLRWLKVDVYI
jgi:hypothetical protein